MILLREIVAADRLEEHVGAARRGWNACDGGRHADVPRFELAAFLREAGVVISELAAIEQEKECGRYQAQGPTISLLIQSDRLTPGLNEKEARDIFWTLTARDVYRMLVDAFRAHFGEAKRTLGNAEYLKILGELRLNPKAKLNPDQAVRVFNRMEETLNART